MSNQNDSNWWEFYGIRYAQGTVIGAMIVYFLFSRNESLKSILFLPSDAKDFGMSHLILLAIYGLTYCYIASAPILVLHAGRGLFFKSVTNPNPNKGTVIRLLFTLAPPTILSGYYFYISSTTPIEGALAIFVYTTIIALQLVMLLNVFNYRWTETIDYYKAIIDKRKAHQESGYVESYKHLREHGNSFLIVFLQFMLAMPIFIFVSQAHITNEDAVRNLCMIMFPWIIPAAAIWIFGNKLENNLQSM
jgi:hypothetical protein